MGLFKRESKVIDPIIHDEEGNFTLSSGVHILNKCQNVSLCGTAIVLESFDCTFKEISGKAKVQMIENGEIDTISGKAKIGLFKSGTINTVCGKASITTISTCKIDYVKDKATIGTMNNGFIRFIDDKAELATLTNGEVMFVRNKAKIVTMITGKITGIENNANLVSMLDGDVTYLLNNARVGTMNNGQIGLFADNSEVSTFNNGRIEEMIGRALISANMDGEIGYQDKQTIILYSPKESARRMKEYRQEKEDAISAAKEISPIGDVPTEEVASQNEPTQIDEKTQAEQNKEEIASDFLTPDKTAPKRKSKPKQLKIDDITTDDKME